MNTDALAQTWMTTSNAQAKQSHSTKGYQRSLVALSEVKTASNCVAKSCRCKRQLKDKKTKSVFTTAAWQLPRYYLFYFFILVTLNRTSLMDMVATSSPSGSASSTFLGSSPATSRPLFRWKTTKKDVQKLGFLARSSSSLQEMALMEYLRSAVAAASG